MGAHYVKTFMRSAVATPAVEEESDAEMSEVEVCLP